MDYRYILIYQLDSFVFSDRLSYWCNFSYDYVGAPWLGVNWHDEVRSLLPFWERKGVFRKMLNVKISNVGNGGFSLRKVRPFWVLSLLLQSKIKSWPCNEDIFWSYAAPSYFPFFKKPDASVALNFAFELDPGRAFELNNYELPFGCHGWWKYGVEFWKEKMGNLGYNL